MPLSLRPEGVRRTTSARLNRRERKLTYLAHLDTSLLYKTSHGSKLVGYRQSVFVSKIRAGSYDLGEDS